MKTAVNTAKLLRNVPLPDEIATVHDNAVIIDIGSGTTRLGFSGDDAPRLSVPTVVGKSKDGQVEFLKKAYQQRDTLQIGHPIERGVITDFDAMEQIFQYMYKDLFRMSPSEPNTPVLLSEAALVPKEQREQLVEILFEKVDVQALYFSPAPVLSLYSSGRTTGMVVEMNHGTVNTVPVFEGFGLFHSTLQLPISGHDLTNHMQSALSKKGVLNMPGVHLYEVAQFLKETHCSVLPDKASYIAAAGDAEDIVKHRLPDGSEISLSTEDRHLPCEALFDPSLLGLDKQKGVAQLALDSVRKCDLDVGPMLFSNVVLAGGTSLFPGMPDRLHKEIQDLAPTEKVRIFAATERRQAAWIGGSILASMPTFQDMWVSKAEYEEAGDVRKAIAHRNCF